MRDVMALADLHDAGQYHLQFMHKSGGPAAFGALRWADLSMGAGQPKYNAYVGSQATATPLTGAGNDGIYTGTMPPGAVKYLYQWGLHSGLTTLAPATFLLLDYVLHYPLIDGDDTDVQVMDNTAGLPRYADGAGLQIMAVCTTPMAANALCEVTYTNSDGVGGRKATFMLLATSVVGVLVASGDMSGGAGAASPFVPLANGDQGVRQIDEVRNLTGAGGFFALVLVQVKSTRVLLETGAHVDGVEFTQFVRNPKLPDGHFLNVIYQPRVSGTAVPFQAWFEFNWS